MTYRDDTAPVVGKPLISSLCEVANLEVPDPYTTFPMCEILKATRILSKEVGDKVWICARADQGTMDLASQIRGLDEFMMDIADDEEEELIHALLDFSRRVSTRYALALIECGGTPPRLANRLPVPICFLPGITASIVTGQLKTSQSGSNQNRPLRGEEFMAFLVFGSRDFATS